MFFFIMLYKFAIQMTLKSAGYFFLLVNNNTSEYINGMDKSSSNALHFRKNTSKNIAILKAGSNPAACRSFPKTHPEAEKDTDTLTHSKCQRGCHVRDESSAQRFNNSSGFLVKEFKMVSPFTEYLFKETQSS